MNSKYHHLTCKQREGFKLDMFNFDILRWTYYSNTEDELQNVLLQIDQTCSDVLSQFANVKRWIVDFANHLCEIPTTVNTMCMESARCMSGIGQFTDVRTACM